MTDMTPAARERLDEYLRRLESGLRGTRAEVAEEVEQSVREHIEVALAEAQGPVGEIEMIGILDRLGAPEQWLEVERALESSVPRANSAADESPLPYISLGLVLVGMVTFMFFGFLLLIPAMFVGRSWIEQKRERGEPLGSKRWLVYPAIALVLAFVALLLLLLPPLGALAFVRGGGALFDAAMDTTGQLRLDAGVRAALFGGWWVIAGALCAAFLRPLRFLFLPLLDGARRKHFAVLSAIGALIALAGAALMYFPH